MPLACMPLLLVCAVGDTGAPSQGCKRFGASVNTGTLLLSCWCCCFVTHRLHGLTPMPPHFTCPENPICGVGGGTRWSTTSTWCVLDTTAEGKEWTAGKECTAPPLSSGSCFRGCLLLLFSCIFGFRAPGQSFPPPAAPSGSCFWGRLFLLFYYRFGLRAPGRSFPHPAAPSESCVRGCLFLLFLL